MSPAPAAAARLRLGAVLAAQRGGLRTLAAVGDPVAAVLLGSPRRDPYPLYERIRARGPVVRSRTGVHAVTSRALCEEVLRDPRLGVRHADGRVAGSDPLGQDALGPLAGSFLELDPPDHTRLRRVAAPAFRPKLVRGWAPRLEALMHSLVDRVEGRGSLDLMADVVAPFPIAVISDLLGIPDADAARFTRIGALAGRSLDGVGSPRQADALAEAGAELEDLFDRLARSRRREPRDDVVSLLVAAQDRGAVSAQDLTATCGLLLVAGFETTVNLIGNAVSLLARHPGVWRDLVDDAAGAGVPAQTPGLAAAVVEETLRVDPSVQLTLRAAHEGVELAGRSLPAGSEVLVVLAAGNRDPAAHARPAAFDPHRRGEAEHLTFSAGIHYCLGAPLARLEGEVALRVLATRLPGLRLLPGARRRPGATIRGFASLPATA